MQTINQEVLDNQNAKKETLQPFYLKDWDPKTIEYWFTNMVLLESKEDEEAIKRKYHDVFKSPYFADFMKDWVFKTDLPEFVKEDDWYKMFIKQNTITGNPSLEDYLQAISSWAFLIEGQTTSNEHTINELREKVDEQYGEILNLQNVVSELYTSVTRLQDVAFPPATPSKPTAKVGWLDRPVSQFNKKTGEFIRNWESPRQAQRVLGKVNAHAIVEHLKRGSGSSGGYIWRVGEYIEEENN